MPQDRGSKYVWPASALTVSDMALLYRARMAATGRMPINSLLAHAVRIAYGKLAQPPPPIETHLRRKEAA